MKIVFFLILVFAISGLFTIGFSDVSASHDGNPGKSEGCKNDTAKNNPHCDSISNDSIQLTACDIDKDGTIDADEIEAIDGVSEKQGENIIKSVTSDGVIDSDPEVKKLNRLLAKLGFDLCVL